MIDVGDVRATDCDSNNENHRPPFGPVTNTVDSHERTRVMTTKPNQPMIGDSSAPSTGSSALQDAVAAIVDQEDGPQVVEIRMDYTKDTVALARGAGCSWK
jgi:hypothetical protein